MKNSTITAVDFASQKISFDVKVTKILQSNQEFHKLTELMVDIVGNQIRKKVRHLFNLKGRLWIARYVETFINFDYTMRTNLLNWCNLVSISKNEVFYAFLVLRIYLYLADFVNVY